MTPGRRLLTRFRPWRWHLFAAVLLVLAGSALQGIPIFLIRYTLDDVLIAKDAGRLAWLGPAVVGLYALNGVVTVGRAMLTRSIAWRVVTDLRDEMYVHLLGLDIRWHLHVPSGERVSRLIGDVNNLQYAVSGVVTAVQKPVTLLVLAGTAVYLNPRLALIALMALPLLVIPLDRFGRWVRRESRVALEAGAKLSAGAQEAFTGIRVVQVFGGEPVQAARFAALNKQHEDAQVRAMTAQLMPPAITEVIAAFGVGAVIWVGGRDVVAGTLAPGDLVAFLVALAVMNQPLKGLTEISAMMQRSLAAAERVFLWLDERSALTGTGHALAPAPKEIRLEGVAVDYGEGPVVSGVDITLRAGQRVALVGASGSGKTSLLGLLPRLYDPAEGRILWDGHPLAAYSLPSLRRQIAVVTQETFLFNDTVAANIRFGRPGASDSEVEDAARVANAHTFILALPQGYDTPIAEAGMRLSGGQRQRLCIARAVLRGAPVLLLDEATSNLDTESESLVQEALDRLMIGRTTLIVAHRLSTIRDADLIVVLARGRIVEQGTHAELLATNGEYTRLMGETSGGTQG